MTVPDVILRDLTASDIAYVLSIAEDLGLSRWSADDYAAEIGRNDSHLRVAARKETVIGFIVGRQVSASRDDSEPEAEIYNIGVLRSEQRSGIGKLLLEDFLGRCKSKKTESVWLEVRAKNKNAISFYENAGFSQFAGRPGFYSDPPDDALIMRLLL